MLKKEKPRIPDTVTPNPEWHRHLQWKTQARILDAQCRKATGYTLLEILVENKLDEARERRKPKKKPGRFADARVLAAQAE